MPDARIRVVLAFDYGLRRIGIASGDTLTATASARAAVACRNGDPDWQAITRVIEAVQPDLLVAGAPYNEDGTAGAMTDRARRFAAELESRYERPVIQVDERYSSLEAQATLKARRASGVRRRRVQREDIDSAAAAVILERWFSGEGLR